MRNDCLVLLSYVAREHPKAQSISKLAEMTGIPRSTLYHIVREAGECEDALLYSVAWEYGYIVKIFDRRGQAGHGPGEKRLILDAIYVGYSDRYRYA